MRRLGLYAGFAVFALAQAGFAATWTAGTTPGLGQIFAVDPTGESGWLFGAEDVFGDGLQNFTAAEQALDLRTAYASTDATQLWTRVYLSSPAQADPTLVAFVFIDADRDTASGGGTSSTTLSPAFTSEHSPGGYEYVVGIGGGTLPRVWQWQAPSWVEQTLTATQGAVETGTDVDPIRIGTAAHAYVQSRVNLSVVGLTQACDANLYVRSARTTGASDLDMTYSTSCVPAKSSGVPSIVVVSGCTSDAQCPENGVCDNGQCGIAPPCVSSADCAAGDTCTTDGRCVPVGACTLGGNDCAAGTRCAPTGACIPGGATTGSGEVEGGAFHCSVSNGPRSTLVFGALASLFAMFLIRRRKR